MSKKIRTLKSILKKQSGTTMVEMVVSFLMLAIFLTTVTMVISNALTTYYIEQRMMSVYSVADTVLKEAREDIISMQGSGQLSDGRTKKGYVKLRNASGGSVTVKEAVQMHGNTVNAYTGDTLEFIKANETDGMIMEQIDSKGSLGAFMIDENGIVPGKTSDVVSDAIPGNQLTARYYLLAAKETKNFLKGKFMDRVHTDSSEKSKYAGADGLNDKVLWDTENRLPKGLYQSFPVTVSFAVETHMEGSDEVADQITVFVKVYQRPEDGVTDPVADDRLAYQKAGVISLQNKVFYSKEETTYSEATSAP